MASPHAVGVAALIISEHGRTRQGDYGMDPAKVARVLKRTATDYPCPEPRTFVYPAPITPDFTATCAGTMMRNGFYGDGIVDAARAVSSQGRP